MKNKTNITTYDKAIAPVIRDVAKTDGLLSETARQLAIIKGKPVSKQQVGMWLNKDAEKRVEPGFTTGHELLEAVRLAKEALAK